MSVKPFKELQQLEAIIKRLGSRAHVEVVEQIGHHGQEFPIYCIQMGSMAENVPVLGFFGGIHGLEKIGSEVLLAYLHTIVNLLEWDGDFNRRLETSRLILMPIINPVGVYYGTRSNGNGVDLMRNAPINSEASIKKLYSGQRLSSRLPWFSGDAAFMEKESAALCQVIRRYFFGAPLSIAVDLHSGFGLHDRLWFPYASSRKPIPTLAEVFAWKQLFDRCYPHHFYKIEPMSQEYVINGDLWDYLYDEYIKNHAANRLFIPLTLEMGSWLWLRKNPLNLFQRYGWFHPLSPHRQQRILRRHFTLFDFIYRSLLYPEKWAHLRDVEKHQLMLEAQALWYV